MCCQFDVFPNKIGTKQFNHFHYVLNIWLGYDNIVYTYNLQVGGNVIQQKKESCPQIIWIIREKTQYFKENASPFFFFFQFIGGTEVPNRNQQWKINRKTKFKIKHKTSLCCKHQLSAMLKDLWWATHVRGFFFLISWCGFFFLQKNNQKIQKRFI